MASVWIARERGDMGDRLVALKAMLPELARRSDFRTMFLAEGQVVRSIEHPNVVRVYEVGEDRGVLFMAMEWVRGDSLQRVMVQAQRRKPIPSEMAVRIIADTAAGLHAAHELRGWDGELRNLVHCDVSPHNILVGVDGRSRLVDFGVANGTALGDPEKDDRVVGKFGYMSPEQAHGERIDRRSDVFSLGIVLFELTTGERLYRGELPAHTLRLAQEARIPNPTRVLPDYPERLASIVLKALAPEREQRFQTSAELRLALEQFLVQERTLISHASVGKLVHKVLKQRLERQDEELREALVATDGIVQGGLVPTARPVGGRPSDPSSHPFANSEPSTSSPPTRRAPVGAVLFGVLGVASAVGSIIWTNLQAKPNALVTTPGGTPALQRATNNAAATRTAADGRGVSLESIPVADTESPSHERAVTHASAPRRTKVTLEEEGVAAPSPQPNPQPNPPPNPQPEQEPAPPSKRGSAAEAVELEETQPATVATVAKAAATEVAPPEPAERPTPAAPLPPPGERGPVSRGAALSALAAAASRATACSNPDGPSGSARAMVTFSPDGPVTDVSLPAPFAGTPVGSCVVSAFRGAHVPPFSGGSITLPQSFRVP